MEVKLINADELTDFFKKYGDVASVCYNTQTDKPELIGKSCFKSGHYSGSRGQYFKFKITNCPRFTIDQLARHEVGVFKNIQSFRYVDKGKFSALIPTDITDNRELVDRLVKHYDETVTLYNDIHDYVERKGKTSSRASEQARYVLPMSANSSCVIGFTIEALVHFMNMRLCTRAEDQIRKLAILMKEEVLNVLPELEEYLVPKCERDLFCTERECCGKAPSKEQVKELLKKQEK